MAAPDIAVRFGADFAGYMASLARIRSATDGTAGAIRTAFGSLSGVLTGLGASLSLAGFVGAFRGVVDDLDNLSKAAQGVGVTVEALSGLRYAFEFAGVESDQFDRALGALNVRLADAKQGTGEAARAFAALKIDPTTLRTADEALLAIADKFAELPDGVEKSALAADFFGERLARAMIPGLNGGSRGIREMTDEAARMGLVMDTETARAAEKLNDNLSRINKVGSGLLVEFFSPAISILADLSEGFRIARFEGQSFFEALKTGATPNVLANVAEQLLRIDEQIKFATAAIAGAEGRNDAPRADFLRAQLAELERRRGELNTEFERLKALNNRLFPPAPSKPGTGYGLTGGAQEPGLPAAATGATTKPSTTPSAAKISEAQRYLDALQAQIDRTRDLSAVEQLNVDIITQKIRLNDRQREQAFELAAEIDSRAAIAEAAQKSLETEREAARVRQATADRIADLTAKYRDLIDPVDEYKQQLREIELLRAGGQLSDGEALRAIAAIDATRDATAKLGEQFDETGNLAREMLQGVTSGFEDAIFEGKKLSDVFKQLAIDIAKLIVRRSVTEPLVNGVLRLLSPVPQPAGPSPVSPAGGALAASGLQGYAGKAAPAVTNVWNIASGVSPMQVQAAVARGNQSAQVGLYDDRVRGGELFR